MELLGHCRAEVHRAGYRVENIDATIVLQQPKLAPFIMRMRENVAMRIGISVNQVSVKAKTSEGMGYTGDGSGIAAFAVALVEPL
jgi:2-C-methyl-D-erythritol 2,4-cyclodiphosphate synthase